MSADNWIQILTIIAGILGAGGVGGIVATIVNRKTAHAEAERIEITGSLEVGKMGLEYADQFRKDILDMRGRITELETEQGTMKKEMDSMRSENIKLRLLVKTLIKKLKPHVDGDEIAQLLSDLEIDLDIDGDGNVGPVP